MAYNKRIYVAYDGKNDVSKYMTMKEWVQSDGSDFPFYDGYDLFKKLEQIPDEDLKLEIRERMKLSEVCVLLATETTKRYRKFIRWQIETAINGNIPLIILNVNGIRSVDYDRIPMILKRKKTHISLHLSFQPEILEFALQDWPDRYRAYLEKGELKTYRYSNKVYESLGLDTSDYQSIL